jgi:hypothetical protein
LVNFFVKTPTTINAEETIVSENFIKETIFVREEAINFKILKKGKGLGSTWFSTLKKFNLKM